jgi:hypothetical protein
MMENDLRPRLDIVRREIDELIRRGGQLRQLPAIEPLRTWQQDCAGTISRLSGGSKAHWLARAYSGAFLIRSDAGSVRVEAEATEIIDRMLGVLRQAAE